MPTIPAPRRQKQENQELKAILDYTRPSHQRKEERKEGRDEVKEGEREEGKKKRESREREEEEGRHLKSVNWSLKILEKNMTNLMLWKEENIF